MANLNSEMVQEQEREQEQEEEAETSFGPFDQRLIPSTKFWSLWRFMLDHPYGTPAGTSPYQQAGLPSGFPEWCTPP